MRQGWFSFWDGRDRLPARAVEHGRWRTIRRSCWPTSRPASWKAPPRAKSSALFRRIIKEQGTTLMMASHDPLVDEYADLIVRLQDGQIMTAG